MEVASVQRIVVGTKRGIEQPAGVRMGARQERPGLRLFAPVARHGDVPAIGEFKSGHVDGIGGGVLAPRPVRRMVDVAAGVAAHVIDCFRCA